MDLSFLQGVTCPPCVQRALAPAILKKLLCSYFAQDKPHPFELNTRLARKLAEDAITARVRNAPKNVGRRTSTAGVAAVHAAQAAAQAAASKPSKTPARPKSAFPPALQAGLEAMSKLATDAAATCSELASGVTTSVATACAPPRKAQITLASDRPFKKPEFRPPLAREEHDNAHDAEVEFPNPAFVRSRSHDLQ